MILVGVTGGLGAGKSTLARMLGTRGAVIVDADELAARALEPGTGSYERVCELFGDEIVQSDGRLDRAAIAQRVFRDPDKRRALESIVHPEVFRGLAETVEAHRDTDHVVVFDVPLLVDVGLQNAFDVVVVVAAPPDQQLLRVMRDRSMSEQDAAARIAAQVSSAERESAADVVIPNDGDLEELERRVEALWADLRRRARRS
jgi:dephospho-CoA kinase